MSTLILINGAPASGKSTLARLLAEHGPLTLVIDIDSIRGAMGQWRRDPIAAGLAARRLAIGAAVSHLATGADVIVPQFLQRPHFVQQLEDAATSAGADFLEVMLVSSPEEASRRFDERSTSADANHRDALELQRAPGADPVSSMYSDMLELGATRPNTIYIESIRGDIDGTLARLRDAVGGHDHDARRSAAAQRATERTTDGTP
jgi:predicted kinase